MSKFVDRWHTEVWPHVEDTLKFLNTEEGRPAKQEDLGAVGVHFGSKILEKANSTGECRNVTCNLPWTGPTANSPIGGDISFDLVAAWTQDHYLDPTSFAAKAAQVAQSWDGPKADTGSDVQDPSAPADCDAESYAAVTASIKVKRVFKIPAITKKGWEVPIGLFSTTELPKKGEFRRSGNDIVVSGSYLALAWAVQDNNLKAKEDIIKLLRNWPFDFKQYAGKAEDAET